MAIKSNSITFIDNAGIEKYLYIRYSDDGATFTENNGTTPGEWLGTCSSNSPTAPTNFDAYTWSKIKGADGGTFYTWIKYADNAQGANMSDSPDGKTYIGIACNKADIEESENPEDYTWSLITSEGRGIDCIEEYYLVANENTGITPTDPRWDTTIPILDKNNKYLWNYEITRFTDGDEDATEPVVIGVYGNDGVGISDIINYYATTPDTTAPTSWAKEAPPMSSTDKYLWNYEEIIYTDSTKKTTTPTIIGVYGDEGDVGADAITFDIYSPKGFEFVDSIEELEIIESIELKTVAFQGSTQITDAIYQWFYLDVDDNEVNIDEGTNSSLIVNVNDSYAFSNLGCKMTYDGNTYRDYVTLRKKVDIYTATIKFFNGTNIFAQNEEYLAGYIELYKNNQLEEGPKTNTYYTGSITIDENNIITPNETFNTEEKLSYFIYNNDGNYSIVLGEYDGTNWIVSDDTTKYVYENNINTNIRSNVFVVSKLDITRSQDVSINVYTNTITTDENVITPDSEKLIAMTRTTIIDLNDTIVSSTPPDNGIDGQLWFDTEENILKVYNAKLGQWVNSSIQHTGQTVYTSQPESYKKGDLWIVEDTRTVISYEVAEVTKDSEGTYWIYVLDGENYVYQEVTLPDGYDSNLTYYNQIKKEEKQMVITDSASYGPGSILKATTTSDEFNVDHWEDATPDLTQMQSNIEQYFNFSTQTGLKIGQTDQKFYVNISSTRMSFCSDPNITTTSTSTEPDPNEVVYIAKDSATIKNLVGEVSADFNCGVSVNNEINVYETKTTNTRTGSGFTWKIESDGSLSLIRIGGAS